MRARTAAFALGAAALLTGCAGRAAEPVAVVVSGQDADGLHGTEISDVIARPALVLPDTEGRLFDLHARPSDELTAVFFGYTRCPDVCPTAMADLAAAVRLLDDEQREDVEVVFVTEDPRTDTPRLLRRYLNGFDTSFTGLVGGNVSTERALDALRAPRTETRAPSGSPTAGTAVDHTGSVYVFHRERSVVYTGGTTPSQYAEDFTALLS